MSEEAPKIIESALHVMPGVSTDQNRVVPPKIRRRRMSVEEHIEGVLAGNRAVIGRTFSLMESANPKHREKSSQVLEKLLPYSGKSIRLGITGVPGVGKSTFIEALGVKLIEEGLSVAVLAVDPSSEVSGGSILGDKTRMEVMSTHPKAFVRPSACGKTLGGVARGTRESIVICEAAGFDVVIIETVGVGQSETQVSSMVDFFLLLMLAGAGDELQGIKRGIIEMADCIAINKADGENQIKAKVARAEYQGAIRLLQPATQGWDPRVVTCSAVEGTGLKDIWQTIKDHHSLLITSGQLEEKRDKQALYWLKQTVEQLLLDNFYRHPDVSAQINSFRADVVEGRISPFTAAERLVEMVSEKKNASDE